MDPIKKTDNNWHYPIVLPSGTTTIIAIATTSVANIAFVTVATNTTSNTTTDRLIGLVVSMSDYWSWGRGFDPQHLHKF